MNVYKITASPDARCSALNRREKEENYANSIRARLSLGRARSLRDDHLMTNHGFYSTGVGERSLRMSRPLTMPYALLGLNDIYCCAESLFVAHFLR